ncbi:MAG: Bacterial type II secretion system protein G [bacterium ADurb.Bin212]|nr:MAG: Bacterial type II secretion system protein G [bacterium ADurb.Bin212]
MADNVNANSDDIKKSSSTSGSPWDDDLEINEEEVATKPQIVGSFEEDVPTPTTPVPFNVPEEVIEDKVGKKIPAQEVMGKDTPKFYIPTDEKASPPNSASEPTNGIIKTEEKVENTAPVTGIDAKPALSLNNNKVEPSVTSTEAQPLTAPSVTTSSNISSANEGGQLNTSNVSTDSSAVAGKSELIDSSIQDNQSQTESGVMELVSKKPEIDPFADPFAPIGKKELPSKNIFKAETAPEPNSPLTTNNLDKSDEKKPVLGKNMDSLAPPPQPSKNQDLNIENDTTTPKQEEAKAVSKDESKKKGIFSRFGLLKGKQQKSSQVETPPVEKSDSVSKSASGENQSEQGIFPDAKQKRSFSPKFAVITAVVLLLVAMTYLTEIGLISVGLENVYGVVGAEKMWGGLPRNVEQALGLSVIKQRESLDFKYSGKLSVTVDKSKKSPLTSPLISYGQDLLPAKDSTVAIWQKATLSQYDYYDDDYFSDYYGDSTDSESDSTSSDSTSSDLSEDSTDSSDTATDADGITSPAPTEVDEDTSASPYEDGDSDESYLPAEPTIKQLDFEIKGESSEESISSSLTLKQLVGANKQIDLMNSAGNLYVKSSDIKFDTLAAEGKWLQYAFENLSSGNNITDVLDINIDSGFSAMGRRVANEKVSGVRAYKYKIDSMELGDSLQKVGILKESISKISGYVWIGVRDHLLRRVSLEIVPSVSSSLTRIQIDVDLYDYNISNSLVVPALTNMVKVETPSSATQEVAVEDVAVEDAADDDITTDDSQVGEVSNQPSPAVTETQDGRTSTDARRHQDLLSIKNALDNYKSRYGQYPKSNSFININSASNILKQSLVPSYLDSIPSDPNSNAGWWYGYKSDGRSFTLSARFENINDREVTKVGGVYLHYVWN